MLTPGSRIGAFQIDDWSFLIRPKLPMKRVLFPISYAIRRGHWPSRDFAFGEEPELVEAVVLGFVYQVQLALRFGLLHGYRSVEESSASLRGRLRFEEQLRTRFGRFPPAEIRYDEFTEDIEENRLLRAAVQRLGRLRLRSVRARRGLQHAGALLATVPLFEYDRRSIPAVNYTRLNEHYRPAVELARLILRSISFEHRHGAVTSMSFLIDMNQVFEDFVIIALRESLGLTDRTFRQGESQSIHLDTARHINLVPDLSWWEAGRCVFVGDATYKRAGVEGINHPNLYQLLAYVTAAHLTSGLLVYAAGEALEGRHHVVHNGPELIIRTLNLDQDAELVLAQVNQIASLINTLRAREVLAPS